MAREEVAPPCFKFLSVILLWKATLRHMTRIQEICEQANSLSDRERTHLAADLLEGLPNILDQEDDGVAEASKRDAKMSATSDAGISWATLRDRIGR